MRRLRNLFVVADADDDALPLKARTRPERIRDWFDLNHSIGVGMTMAGLLVGLPRAFLAGGSVVFPLLGAANGALMARQATWFRVDSPRLADKVALAERAKRITKELCAEIGCKEPRLYLALTSKPSASATSLGGRGIMVINSGLLRKMDDRTAKAVLAHEMGHIRQRHLVIVRMMTLPFSFINVDRLAAAGLALVHISSLPGFLVSVGVGVGFVGGVNGALRVAERAADAYSVRVMNDPLAMADALRSLHAPVMDGASEEPPAFAEARSMVQIPAMLSGPASAPPIWRRGVKAASHGLLKVVALLVSTRPPDSKRIAWIEARAARLSSPPAAIRDAPAAALESLTGPATPSPAGPTPILSLLGRVAVPGVPAQPPKYTAAPVSPRQCPPAAREARELGL